MKFKSIILAVILAGLQLCGSLWAAPMTADEAEMVVMGWLTGNSHPLGATLGRQVEKVETFTNRDDEPIYYIVYLQPAGFVIVSADDLVEPIIGFSDEGTYDPSQNNPLGALVTNDLNRRITAVRSNVRLFSTGAQSPATGNQKKWNSLISRAAESKEGLRLMAINSISDIRVAPLIKSKWGQGYVCGLTCFNYYTPNNYPCGCVATAIAQLMRYHRYPNQPNDYDPSEPDNRRRFWISVIVDDEEQMDQRFLRGGDGSGGPYQWGQFVSRPGCDTTLEQRQAIGSICYDAGIATGMVYSEGGSGAYSWDIPVALQETFNYSNAIHSMSEDSNEIFEIEGERLENMVNTNLDAGNPVIFGITEEGNRGGHAIICDGYGYDNSTLYHHLNLGFTIMQHCPLVWYALPDVSDRCTWEEGYYIYILEYSYDSVIECVYNIFTVETGEIISGRVIDTHGRPIDDAVVTAQSSGSAEVYTSTSNSNGIYALVGLDSNTTYRIMADVVGYDFEPNEITTGISVNGSPVSGNKWGVNLTGYNNCEVVTIGTRAIDWDYPLRTYYEDCRTQVIYLASEIGRSGFINALELNVVESPGQKLENWTIRMKHTSMSRYGTDTCLLEADGWTVVYQSNESVAARWSKFEFQTPFEYNGTDNLMIDFSFNNSSYSRNGSCEASNPGGMRSVYAVSDSRHGDPLDWPAASAPTMHCSSRVPNIRLSLCEESTVIDTSVDVKLISSDGVADGHFGRTVSIIGDYAIVGERRRGVGGLVFVFKHENAEWTQQDKLALPVWEREKNFGLSTSMSGDYAIIGANGSAYIYELSGTSWTQQAILYDLRVDDNDEFGSSVSISGDYAIVGAPSDNDDAQGSNVASGYDYGSAYIFKRDGASWTSQTKLIASDSLRGKMFGYFVSIDGDYAIIANQPSAHGVYIFKRDGEDWAQQTRLTTMNNLYVYSISISGEYAVVGASTDLGNLGDSGTIYVFKREGASWALQTELIALDSQADNRFGESVSISGDYIIVGAPYYDDDTNGRDSGSAYVFKREGTDWIQWKKLTAWDGGYDDYFGSSVSIDGDYVIVGAKGDDNDNGIDSGSAYIFKLE